MSLTRTPEPELMNEAEQALAYAQADFSVPHNQFIDLFRSGFANLAVDGAVLDVGCGPADVTLRFAKAYPDCRIDGVDGAPAMLALGRASIEVAGLSRRINLIEGYLPGAILPRSHYDVILSNSLLHHLADPQVLWEAIRRYGKPRAAVFIMDLRRPDTSKEIETLVRQHAAGEPPLLQRDFHHSLHAAYRPEEVRQQINQAGLEALTVTAIGDRHLIIHGYCPATAEPSR
jgi:ubiquinone/menaquinone biosynthesis C-methylase UbiE